LQKLSRRDHSCAFFGIPAVTLPASCTPQVALLRKLRSRHIVEFIGCSWTRSDLDDVAAAFLKVWEQREALK